MLFDLEIALVGIYSTDIFILMKYYVYKIIHCGIRKRSGITQMFMLETG